MIYIRPMSELEQELAGSLRDVLICLTEHLSQEAHEKDVPVERLCPCHEDQSATARAILERLGYA